MSESASSPILLAPALPASYHGAVSEFKRRLIEATLHQAQGNRTHAARALGLQRTYLLRLIRDLRVAAPPPPPRRGLDRVRAPGRASSERGVASFGQRGSSEGGVAPFGQLSPARTRPR